jgi:hypothetical protein
MHKTRIVVVALALTVAACGGTSEGDDALPQPEAAPSTTAAPAESAAPDVSTTSSTAVPAAGGPVQMAVVHAAIEKVAAEPPSRIEGIIEMAGLDSDFGPMDLSIPFSTSFDYATGDGHMMMDFSDMAEMMAEQAPEFADMFGSFEVRQIGDTAYVSFGMLNMMFGADSEWLSMPVEDGEGFTEGFTSGINPYDATEFLDSLPGADGELTAVGTETIRGIETTHYQALFDMEAMAEFDPDGFAEMQEAGPIGLGPLPMDFWIDDKGRLHRYLFEVDGSEVEELANDEDFEYMRVQFDFSGFGERVTIEPPPASDVTDVADLGDMFTGFDT